MWHIFLWLGYISLLFYGQGFIPSTSYRPVALLQIISGIGLFLLNAFIYYTISPSISVTELGQYVSGESSNPYFTFASIIIFISMSVQDIMILVQIFDNNLCYILKGIYFNCIPPFFHFEEEEYRGSICVCYSNPLSYVVLDLIPIIILIFVSNENPEIFHLLLVRFEFTTVYILSALFTIV